MVFLKLTATLTDSDGNPLSGKTIEFYKSTDGVNYTLIATKTTDENGVAETTDEITETGTYYYKAKFPGDDQYESSEASAEYTYSPTAPLFVISDYPSKVTVTPGASFTIEVMVYNNGGVEGTVEIRVRDHNGNIVASKQTTISAASYSPYISLSAVAPSVTGIYAWSIEAYNTATENIDDSKPFTVEVTEEVAVPSEWIQVFMQWLPYILVFMLIILIIVMLVSAII